MRGLLIPSLVMSSGDGSGSYALGSEHHKIFRQMIDGKLKAYKQAILDQFVRKIIAYNFPELQWKTHGYGDFVVEEFDPEAMEKLANIYQNLTTNGYMSPEDQIDMDGVREKMNLKPKKAVVMMTPDPLMDAQDKEGVLPGEKPEKGNDAGPGENEDDTEEQLPASYKV